MKKFVVVFLLIFSLPFYGAFGAPELKQDVVELLKPKLNSDRIAYFFGSYGVDPIAAASSPFGESRIANLHSIHDGQKVMRTLAVVDFQQPVHDSLKQVHQAICQGQSVGIALRQNGWNIDKLPVYFGSVALSPQVKEWMQEKSCNQAAVHIYQLHVSKDSSKEKLHYCTIIEVHSPQYLDEKWLQSLYQDQYESVQKSSDKVDGLISSLKVLIREFPSP